MKTFIFEPINQCSGTLPGPEAKTFISQRYTVFGHQRAFKNALASGAWQLTLKCSNDGRIFYLQQFMLTATSILLGHRQLKSLHLPLSTGLDQATAIATDSKEIKHFFLGTFSFLSYFPLLVIASVLSFPCFFSFKPVIK